MIKPDEKIIIYCPNCGHRAFDVEVQNKELPNIKVITKCRWCKSEVRYPENSRLKTLIRENQD